MPSEYISKDVPATEAEFASRKWSLRHPLLVLVLLGLACAGAMALVALFAAV